MLVLNERPPSLLLLLPLLLLLLLRVVEARGRIPRKEAADILPLVNTIARRINMANKVLDDPARGLVAFCLLFYVAFLAFLPQLKELVPVKLLVA